MTQDEFRNKVNQSQLSEEERTVCLYWFEHCKGKKVESIAEGDISNILLNANRYYGRINAPKKEKKAKVEIDYNFYSLKKAINESNYDQLLIFEKELNKLTELVSLCKQNKEFQAYQEKKAEVEKLVNQLNKMRDDVKVVISTEQNQ